MTIVAGHDCQRGMCGRKPDSSGEDERIGTGVSVSTYIIYMR
jgi:hypothetical protein